jgi:transposase
MSQKERNIMVYFSRVKRGEMTVVSAAQAIGLSVRQCRRLWKRYRQEGDKGLVHRLRGRPSGRKIPLEKALRIVKRHQDQYADFGPTFACEKLAQEGLSISPNTLSRLLKDRGIWIRKRKNKKHRKRRERRSCLGMMLQMDGSHHDWFEGRSAKCVLMVMIDDATNKTYARFYPAETTQAAFDVFGRWIRRYGVCGEVYVDRHGIYRDEDHPDKPTQFGRAMKELGVRLIMAHSPQAKGRVERRNAVFQDRLVKEMRLRGIRDMDQANAFLEQVFLEEMNRRYSVEARKSADAHRPLAAGEVLEEILCVKEERTVGQDWCVRWKNRWLQIDQKHESLNLAGRRATVRQLADGALRLSYGEHRLEYEIFGSQPERIKTRKQALNNRICKPSNTHPWRRQGVGRAAVKEQRQGVISI